MSRAGEDEPPKSPRAPASGLWLAALLLYAAAIHHGVGPAPAAGEGRWYAPREALLGWDWLRPLLDSPPLGVAVLSLPALVLAGGVFATARSAIARALAASAAVATALFLFYGIGFPLPWRFFHWRGSVAMIGTALCVGLAATAPWLAESWLRLGWARRLALFAPIGFAEMALIRNATGTDPSLRFAISPWPVIPVFGLEVGVSVIAAWLAGLALGAAGLAASRARSGGSAARLALAGIVGGAAAPALLVGAASELGVFPFRIGPRALWLLSGSCAVGIALLAMRGGGDRAARLRRRAHRIAVGAALAAIPLLAGLILERHDYHTTRDRRAQQIIDALQDYYRREQVYPESLEALVEAGDLASVPRPQIGFAFLYRFPFQYQDFGTSYVLDFPAPRWVQCAYNPPWEDEDAEGEEGGESLAGAWSCPSEPPELW